jgi:spore maturation protein CgeB
VFASTEQVAAPAWPACFPGLGELFFNGREVRAPGGAVARLEPGPRGRQGLSHSENGRTVRLASAVDPAAEDLALLRRLGPGADQGVLCLGLGLGYQVEALARLLDPETPLWVLESRPELAACALRHRDFSELFQRPGFRLLVGPFEGPPWAPGEIPPARVLWRPATARHFAHEYPDFLRERPRPKARRARRLLLFQSGYFLDRELLGAARELNLESSVWRFKRSLRADGDNYRELLKIIGDFRPDLLLTVNHLGFDADGLLDDLLARLSVPAASWFVDSPVFILGRSRPGPGIQAFSWDRDYLPFLRGRGFAGVHYLPLASDGEIFKPPPRQLPPARNLAFVGDSLSAATEKCLGQLKRPWGERQAADFLAAVDALAEDFLAGPELLPDRAALARLAEKFGLNDIADCRGPLGSLVTWRASRLWRLKVLRALPWPNLTVAGDRHWGGLLGLGPGRLCPPLDYYRDLAAFYQGSRVNLNITSAQMKTGLNQRVFDVPAAGAFLLTDWRGQLEEAFEPGREVVAYRSPEEARGLAAWYAAPEHDRAREKVVRAARRRVRGEHLYRHRLAKILAALES